MIPTRRGADENSVHSGFRIRNLIHNPVWWGGCTILIGITGLCGWIMGSRFLVTIIPQSITMAPVSAFLFIILGISISISRSAEKEPDYAIIRDILLFPPIFVGIWVMYDFFSTNSTSFSWNSGSAYQIFLMAPESRMSLMSAILFPSLSIGAYLTRWVSRHVSLVFFVIMVCSAGFVGGYCLGHPFFYGAGIKPISFLSALGFFLCATGLWVSVRNNSSSQSIPACDKPI